MARGGADMTKKELGSAKGLLKKHPVRKAMTDKESRDNALDEKSSSQADPKVVCSHKKDSDLPE